MNATWTDKSGLTRTGELLDSLSFAHPKMGQVEANLYRMPATDQSSETITLEMVVGSKTNEYRMADEAQGRSRMAQLRAQARN
jgi:hypothetical protein